MATGRGRMEEIRERLEELVKARTVDGHAWQGESEYRVLARLEADYLSRARS